MVTGTSVKTSKEALRLTRIYPGVLYSTAGNSSSHQKLLQRVKSHFFRNTSA